MSDGQAVGGTKAWGGRFAAPPDARLEAFNASVAFDVRMVREDIRGSVAHVRMLGRQGIVGADEAAAIEAGLWRVWDEVEAGTFGLTVADEDVHTGVERRLRDLVGSVTGKLHTGRSRNDQVATDLRLWTKGALLALIAGVLDLSEALLDVAAAHPTVAMPGYTHLQRAQPVLLAHHLLAYVAMLGRDADRLRDAYRRADVSPLGSGALAGVTYPIDRDATAADLGFADVSANSLDAVGDRDFVLDALHACALVAIHVSRLSEELILWSSAEFRYVTIDDAFATGSSIMPQKKNPDVAELGRGKAGRVVGHLVAMLTVAKGLPLAYNKDLQEDKEGLFDAVDTTLAVLDVFPPMLRTLRFDAPRMAAAAVADFSLATDAADLLAREGVPFREAHEVVGRLVGRCAAEGRTFADLSDAEWAEIHPVFGHRRPPLDAMESIAARDVPGGTAPGRVLAAHAAASADVATARSWLEEREAALAAVLRRPPANKVGG
ncbi:MAG: Argininosuccinate lyase [uncultured Thermomicrobiales bacterium]|uniref:Argininosuccinate lyase n=1 Tax=uncultured Thermomicrobiales bacterium TaxID=1645740 RepID=A0A6J4V8H6_9BACT|nr:MAG: Argininosuccinate lyase [uncultured Thermomicrobiales bacterium]